MTPHEPVEYHRLLRTLPRYRWWKPLVAIVVGLVYYLVLSVAAAVVFIVVGIVTGDIRIDTLAHLQTDLGQLGVIDAASPLLIAFALVSIALMLPAVQLAMLTVGLRPTSVRHSVGFRLRWRWMLISLGPAALILALNLGAGLVIGGLQGEWPLPPSTPLATFAVCAVIVLVLTPFQAAAEEYVFRGLLAQALGAWVRFVPVAILVPSLLFASAHFYDIWGLVDVALFGIAAAIVVWRTGGLEAAIAMHTVNNIASFLLLASGVFGTTINEAETSGPIGPSISVVTLTLWVLWMSWLAPRAGVARVGTFAPPAMQPVPAGQQPRI